jgi:hypothetical protein
VSTPPSRDLLPDHPMIRALRAWAEAESPAAQNDAGRAYCAEVTRITGDPTDGVRDLLMVTRRAIIIARRRAPCEREAVS